MSVDTSLADLSAYDVAVIGGSAAGLSAALVLSRARRKVLVVDSGQPRNAPADQMHGYLSRDGLAPTELLAIGREEVKGYGGEVLQGTVAELAPNGRSGFRVRLTDGRRVSARRLLVATGLRDELPDIPGLAERWARDVLHCPYYHGWEVRDRRLAVLGGPPDAVRYAQIVRQWAADVVFFAPAGSLTATDRSQLVARAIGVVEGPVARLVVEDDRLKGVEMTDGRMVARDALFVPPRLVPVATCSSSWVAKWTRTAGRSAMRPATRACWACGWRATSPTRAPKSSPPPAKGPPQPSPSTPT
jgi:thioredoxin reductase